MNVHPGTLQLVVDVDEAILQVNILYRQSAELADSHSCIKEDVNHLVVFAVHIVVVHKFQELPVCVSIGYKFLLAVWADIFVISLSLNQVQVVVLPVVSTAVGAELLLLAAEILYNLFSAVQACMFRFYYIHRRCWNKLLRAVPTAVRFDCID